MPAPQRPTADQLQAQCNAWNRANPSGTLVAYESIKGQGETSRHTTIGEAMVLNGHSAVIWLQGKSGCVALDHCTPVQEAQA
ncbi:hypothetical protein [Pseudomonas alloputida]|uniref:hypothetical protein n=1 Tax=Pseudomonas alloputida TaxID=1940621 RepID=UPI00386F7B97